MVAATVSRSFADPAALSTVVAQTPAIIGTPPTEVVADGGGAAAANDIALEESKITGDIPDPKRESLRRGTA